MVARQGYEILSKAKDSFLVLDTDLNIVSMKSRTCAMLGYDYDEVIGRPLKRMVAHKCYPRLKWAFAQTRHHPALYRRVYFLKKGGGTFRVDYHLFNVFKESREIFVGIADRGSMPTETKRHCSGRSRRCKDFRALYNIGKLTHQAATLDEVLNGVAGNLAWAADHPQLTATRVVFDGTEYLGSEKEPLPGSNRITADLTVEGRKRGEIEMSRLKSNRPFPAEKRELLSEIGSTVSKFLYRKEIERLLAENSSRLETLFDTITDLLFTIGPDFTIKMINKDMDVVGRKCHQAFYGLATNCPNCPAVMVQFTQTPGHTEKVDGNRTFNVSVYPSRGTDQQAFDMVVRSREITQEKNLEQQLIQAGKMASLGELVSGIAHEINNPNTFIRGNISILAEALETILPLMDKVSEETPDLKVARLPYPFFRDKITTLVSDMEKGADRIANIIADLRQFARPEEGHQKEDFAVNEVIETCLRLVQNQVKRSAEVHLDFAPGLPLLKGSITKMEQLLVNIIINASQAVAEKGKTGNIWIGTSLDEEENISIHIRDDGVGMTPYIKDRLFNPFFTTKRHRQGTGLGLSIVYSIVTSFKGVICVESQPGKGSEFKITIPPNPDNSLLEGDWLEHRSA